MHKALLILTLAGCLAGGLAACYRTPTAEPQATPTATPTPPRTPEQEVIMAYSYAEKAFSELNAHNRKGALDNIEVVQTSLQNATTVKGTDELRTLTATVKDELEKKENKKALESLNKLVSDSKAEAEKAQKVVDAAAAPQKVPDKK